VGFGAFDASDALDRAAERRVVRRGEAVAFWWELRARWRRFNAEEIARATARPEDPDAQAGQAKIAAMSVSSSTL
jgi:hypothetical protein